MGLGMRIGRRPRLPMERPRVVGRRGFAVATGLGTGRLGGVGAEPWIIPELRRSHCLRWPTPELASE